MGDKNVISVCYLILYIYVYVICLVKTRILILHKNNMVMGKYSFRILFHIWNDVLCTWALWNWMCRSCGYMDVCVHICFIEEEGTRMLGGVRRRCYMLKRIYMEEGTRMLGGVRRRCYI